MQFLIFGNGFSDRCFSVGTYNFGFQFQFLVSVYPTDRTKVTYMQATTSNRFLLFEWVFFPSFYDRFLLQGLFVRYRALNRVSNHTTDYAAKRKYGIGSVKKQATQLFFSMASFLKLDPNIFGFRTHAHQSQGECFIKQERLCFHFFHYVFTVFQCFALFLIENFFQYFYS